MKINPLDIRRQQFAKKTFGGYDSDEVDGFMKQLAEQWESALDDVRTANERAADMESKLKHYERVEMALQEALETARDTGRRAEAMAEQKTKMMIEEAELRARQILQDAERDRHGIRQDLVKLSSRQNEIGARLRGFLLSELEILAQYQGDDPVGFIKLQPADPSGGRHIGPVSQAPRLEQYEQLDEDEAFSSTEAPPASSYAPYTEPLTADSTPIDSRTFEMPPSEPSRDPEPVETPAPEPEGAPVTEAPEPVQPEPIEPVRASEKTFQGQAPDSSEPVRASAPPSPEPDEAPVSTEAPSSAPAWVPDAPAEAPPPSWNLRSLVTGERDSVAGSEAERDRIRRILDDLD